MSGVVNAASRRDDHSRNFGDERRGGDVVTQPTGSKSAPTPTMGWNRAPFDCRINRMINMASRKVPRPMNDDSALAGTETASVSKPTTTPDAPPQHLSVADEIRVVLDGISYPAIRRLRWEFDDGVLVLEGVIPSFYLKQIVCSAVMKVTAVRQIVDHMEVCDATADGGD